MRRAKLLFVESGLRTVTGASHRAVVFEIGHRTGGLLKSGNDKLVVYADAEVIVRLNIRGIADEA